MLDEFIGSSPAISKLRRMLPTYSTGATPLVIIGKPGAGKSLFASHIHHQSVNKDHNLGYLNFSVLSDRDQRIGLFGGEPPDLTTTRKSMLEYPTTVVLKHIDHLPHYYQDKLAGSLVSLKIERIGSPEPHTIVPDNLYIQGFYSGSNKEGKNFRIIIKEIAIAQNYLNSVALGQPEDIRSLAEYYLRKFYSFYRKIDKNRYELRGLDEKGNIIPDLLEVLSNHQWDENVRGLMAYLRSIVAMPYEVEFKYKEKNELMKAIMMVENGNEFSLPESLRKIEREIINLAMKKYDNQQTKAAQALGITDRDIRRKYRS